VTPAVSLGSAASHAFTLSRSDGVANALAALTGKRYRSLPLVGPLEA
jgi:hypothetical protein